VEELRRKSPKALNREELAVGSRWEESGEKGRGSKGETIAKAKICKEESGGKENHLAKAAYRPIQVYLGVTECLPAWTKAGEDVGFVTSFHNCSGLAGKKLAVKRVSQRDPLKRNNLEPTWVLHGREKSEQGEKRGKGSIYGQIGRSNSQGNHKDKSYSGRTACGRGAGRNSGGRVRLSWSSRPEG